jgi:hypothetical protein
MPVEKEVELAVTAKCRQEARRDRDARDASVPKVDVMHLLRAMVRTQ